MNLVAVLIPFVILTFFLYAIIILVISILRFAKLLVSEHQNPKGVTNLIIAIVYNRVDESISHKNVLLISLLFAVLICVVVYISA